MRTYPLRTPSGEIYAFEVGNTLLSAAKIARIVQTTLGAQITYGPNRVFARSDVRLRFMLRGVGFQVWEPFGDNSRYWVGPESDPPTRHASIDAIQAAIEAYEANPIQRLLSLWRRRRAA